jgi:hypothetical protein
MYGERKPFSKSLHSSNDPQSRRVVIEYFRKQGIPLKENTNQFGVDLLSPDGTLQIEVEHRLPWTEAEWPFADINVPERKAKFLAEGKAQYIILSRDFSRMGIIRGEDVKEYIVDENLHLNKNKFVKDGEYFYKVPTDKFKWVSVNETKKKTPNV